jgi:hypothetical protein
MDTISECGEGMNKRIILAKIRSLFCIPRFEENQPAILKILAQRLR